MLADTVGDASAFLTPRLTSSDDKITSSSKLWTTLYG